MLTHPIPVNVVTARLMTARYVKALVSHQERELCLAGLWVITGFEQVPMTVQKGSRADSSYTTRKRLSVFANAITSFSNRPLIYIFQIGVAVMALSVVAGVALLYMSLNGRIGVPGWASIMVSIWFLGGLIIFCVGVIGMYLAKIFMEIKQRPYTIVRAEYGSGQESVRKDRPYARELRPASRPGTRLLRGEAPGARSDAGRRGLELAGVAGAALCAARQSLARRSGRQHPGLWLRIWRAGRLPARPRASRHLRRLRRERGDGRGRRTRAWRRFPRCRVTARREDLQPADYAVASGVFNVKQDASDEAWRTYIWETVADLAALGTRGFAFNALTAYSDADKRRPDLFYADPLEAFDRCKRSYSRFVTLLHDYPLYEFTIIVRR